MHPDTMHTLGLNGTCDDVAADRRKPVFVTSQDYDRSTITLYY
jgi:hypothetical protein